MQAVTNLHHIATIVARGGEVLIQLRLSNDVTLRMEQFYTMQAVVRYT